MKRVLPPTARLVAFAYKNYLLRDPIIRRLRELADPRRTAVEMRANIGVYNLFLPSTALGPLPPESAGPGFPLLKRNGG